MSIDSTLPSPSSLSSPSLGFEGLPGRRRKKRTSIETNVRVALERSFIAVRARRAPRPAFASRLGVGAPVQDQFCLLSFNGYGGDVDKGKAVPDLHLCSHHIQRDLFLVLFLF